MSWRSAILTWVGVSVGAWVLIASLFVGISPNDSPNIATDEDYENLGDIAPAGGPCVTAEQLDAATDEERVELEALPDLGDLQH